MVKWELIEESAPHDGETEFLAWAPNTKTMAVCVMENISTTEPYWVCRIPDFNFDYSDHPEFELWTPLPDPPPAVLSEHEG